eukprot:295938-Chlamydomonas_euryale.AAC.2
MAALMSPGGGGFACVDSVLEFRNAAVNLGNVESVLVQRRSRVRSTSTCSCVVSSAAEGVHSALSSCATAIFCPTVRASARASHSIPFAGPLPVTLTPTRASAVLTSACIPASLGKDWHSCYSLQGALICLYGLAHHHHMTSWYSMTALWPCHGVRATSYNGAP